jgi:conjugative relaxase-like TrwC/TraI family protein
MTSGSAIQKSGDKYSHYLCLGQYEQSFWRGSGSEKLGISGALVDNSSFQSLTDLKSPITGEQLKIKHKQKVTMWDLTASAPKSVSLAALYDPEIIEAHQEAVKVIPKTEEGLVKSRNLIYTQVTHHESRAGDPQLHTHTPIINLTFNPESGKWECLRHNFMNYWAQMKLTEAYRTELAQGIIRLGYGIEDRPNYGFEISGVAEQTIIKYSQRGLQFHSNSKYPYKMRAYINRPHKVDVPLTYGAFLETQRDKLTLAERQSLKQVVEKAGELRYKLGVPSVGEGSGGGPSQARWSYGYLV